MRRWRRRALAGGLVACVVAPPAAHGGSLGTVRGPGGAEASLDGRTWLPLGGTPLPVMDGTEIRTTTGVALLELAAGTRINVLPFTATRVRASESATEVLFRCGRLTFRLPDPDRVAIVTPAARLESARQGVTVGEVFSDRAGTTGLKVLQGVMRVRELSGQRRTLLTHLDPVFVPRRPALTEPLFISDLPGRPAPGTKAVFTADGKSFGYLTADGQPMVEPGFSADLTGPFAERTIQAALAGVPERQRAGYQPLFDVNGVHVGGIVAGQECAEFIAGPVAAPGGLLPGLAAFGIPVVGTGVTAVVIRGVGGSAPSSSGGAAATPIEPRRSP